MRAMFSGIAPPEQRSIYFGLYTAVERLAYVIMPLIWSAVMVVLSDWGPSRYRVAVGVMIIFVGCGLALIPQLGPANRQENAF